MWEAQTPIFFRKVFDQWQFISTNTILHKTLLLRRRVCRHSLACVISGEKPERKTPWLFFFCSSKAFILFPSLNSVLMNTGLSRGHDGRSSAAAAPAAFADKNSSVISSLRNERNHAQAHRRRKRVSCERQKYNSLHPALEKLTASAPPVVSRRRNLSVGR